MLSVWYLAVEILMMKSVNKRLLCWADSITKKFEEMDDEELSWIDVPCCRTEEEKIFVQEKLIEHGAIPIEKLEVGSVYVGFCRNASEAEWRGDKFVYRRTKFGYTYDEEINHFQHDDGYDVFVPIKIKI